MKHACMIFVVVFLASCTRQPKAPASDSALHAPTEPNVMGADFVYELESDGRRAQLVLSNQALRISHFLKNQSDRDIILYDLENCVLPQMRGPWGIAGSGPSSEQPRIILAPGQSVSRWVELSKTGGTKDHAGGITVRMQGTGYSQTFGGKTMPNELQFSVGYESKVFEGKCDGTISSVLSTPELTIQLEK